MNSTRRYFCASAFMGLGALLCARGVNATASVKAAIKERVIKIQAKKFNYTPNRIVLKKDQPVVLELTALDFTHGFTIPDMHVRTDIPPGQIVTLHLTPNTVGEYDFLCDNFCGEGHEQMSGKIIVEA